jgi:hypothetical protein
MRKTPTKSVGSQPKSVLLSCSTVIGRIVTWASPPCRRRDSQGMSINDSGARKARGSTCDRVEVAEHDGDGRLDWL